MWFFKKKTEEEKKKAEEKRQQVSQEQKKRASNTVAAHTICTIRNMFQKGELGIVSKMVSNDEGSIWRVYITLHDGRRVIVQAMDDKYYGG